MNKDFVTNCQKISKINDGLCIMSFSCGKDSIASFLRILETGIFKEYFLYFYYLIPELSFVENYINYFKDKFKNVKITFKQYPNPTFHSLFLNGSFQNPVFIKELDKFQKKNETFVKYNISELQEMIMVSEKLGDKYVAVGIKESDSMMRRTVLRKNGYINENLKKWYPIGEYTNRDIVNIIKKYDVLLPEDYELFGLTFDGLDYRFLKPLKEKKPEDYQKVKYFFPLIDLAIARHERYKGFDIKKSKFQKENLNNLKVLK